MSTRAAIARRTASGFTGVYHHWDGYPTALGATLFNAYNGHFKKDVNKMLAFLIEAHPAGWSTVNGADFTKEPGYAENGFRTSGPQCYCHGGRHEAAMQMTERNASGSGVEYAYVFDGNKMLVLSSFCEDGSKMVGMFGCGDPKAKWSIIAEVDLNGQEPDWEKIGN